MANVNTFPNPILAALKAVDVELNGIRPWDPQIHNNDFYARVLRDGTLGFGESYVDGWWDCKQLDELVARLLRADACSALHPTITLAWSCVLATLTNRQLGRRAFRVGETHYDAGNDLYRAMLDTRLTYTCGYWTKSTTLDDAQEAKLDGHRSAKHGAWIPDDNQLVVLADLFDAIRCHRLFPPDAHLECKTERHEVM